MNKAELTEPPPDLASYVEASHRNTFDQTQLNLRSLILQGTSNIVAYEFPYEVVENLAGELR